MSNSNEWLTTKEVAQLLRVTERQIGHYAQSGKIRVRREGRRVFYWTEDVEKLARDLRVDVRPQIVRREDATQEVIRYVRERAELDTQRDEATAELLRTQREMDERLQRSQREMDERLQRIEQQTQQRGPSWQVVAVVALALAIVLVLLIIVLRFV